MPFNEIIVNYSEAIDTYEDYIAFHQMYTCANQMNLSTTSLSDSNGELLPYENCIQLNPYENEYIQLFIQKILTIFKSSLYINMLEPSYILFYKAMIYFSTKFGIAPQYEDSYTYKLITRIPMTTAPPTTVPRTTVPRTTVPPTTVPPTTVPITTPATPFCSGFLATINRIFTNTFTQMIINNISNTNTNIMTMSNNRYTYGAFKFSKEGEYNLTVDFTQYRGGNGGDPNTIAIKMIGVNSNTGSDFIPSISNIEANGYSEGNGTSPQVKDNNIAYFYNKIANNGTSYKNLFQYKCTIIVNYQNIINNDCYFIDILAYDGQARFGTPNYDNRDNNNPGNPIFIVTQNI